MKSNSVFIMLFFTTIIMLAQQKEAPIAEPDSVLANFQNYMRDWIDAYNGGNAGKLAPLYAEDAEYISAHVAGLVAKGRDRLIENFQNGMNMGGRLDSVEILSMNISCNLATLVCKYEANNSGQKASGRTLLVLQKINGTWLIVTHMTVV